MRIYRVHETLKWKKYYIYSVVSPIDLSILEQESKELRFYKDYYIYKSIYAGKLSNTTWEKITIAVFANEVFLSIQ